MDSQGGADAVSFVDALFPAVDAAALPSACNRLPGSPALKLSFTLWTEIPISFGNAHRIAVSDLNGDAKLDFVVISDRDDPTDSLYVGLGDGRGAFTVRSFPFATSLSALAIGDVDNDAIPDVAITAGGITAPAQLRLLLGRGDGTFTTSVSSLPLPQAVLALRDLNGDHNLDLVLSGGPVEVAMGDGRGGFRTVLPVLGKRCLPSDTGPGCQDYATTIIDANEDGFPDLISTDGEGSLFIQLNNRAGQFATATMASPSSSVLCCGGSSPWCYLAGGYAADFNGDGHIDIVTKNGVYECVNPVVFLGDGKGSFPTSKSSVVSPLRSGGDSDLFGHLQAADFDLDGNLDLAGTGANARTVGFFVLSGNGDGTFQDPAVFQVCGPWDLAVGDFNGDCRPDVAVVCSYPSDKVSIFLNTSM